MSPPSPTLVVGAAIGLPADAVLPFLTSLRASGYRGGVVLVVDRRLAQALRAEPLAAGVELVTVAQYPPFRLHLADRRRIARLAWTPIAWAAWIALRAFSLLPPGRLRRRTLSVVAQLASPPMDARFFYFHRELAARPHERILLTDVRDVLFQRDPFAQLPEDGLAVGIETPEYTIAGEPHNAAWLRRVYGAAVLARLGERPVSCVGVTYGSRARVLAYLEAMVGELAAMSPRRAGQGGADTAAHNYLLWTGRLDPVAHLETLAGPLATLNGVDGAELDVTAEGRLRNRDGSEPSIVHQYDRIPGLAPALLRALAYSTT